MSRKMFGSWVLSHASVLVLVVVSCVASGKPPRQESAVGERFGYYVRVVEGLWIAPLGLKGRELSLATNFYSTGGPDVVRVDVLGDVNCDVGNQQKILETQLMLSNGPRVTSYVYREPGGVRVDAQIIEKRIAAALAFVQEEWNVTPSGPISVSRGLGETWRRIPLKGPGLSGSALFDTATGRLVGLDLVPEH